MTKGEKLAREIAGVIAQPALRSMVPSMSRGQYFETLVEMYLSGWNARGKDVVKYLKKYREAYGEDLFPPKDIEQFDPMVRTAVAGRMGRFILDNCIKDLERSEGDCGGTTDGN